MRKWFISLVLALVLSAPAFGISVIDANKMFTGDEEQKQFISTYITVVIKTIHDIDMYAKEVGKLEPFCTSDGTPMSEESAAITAKELWNALVADARKRQDDEVLQKEVTIAFLEFFDRQETCGPTI